MKDCMETIKMRRSVRGFDSEKQVGEEAVKKILESAMYAPLAVNKPSWHLSVVRNAEIIGEIASGTVKALSVNPNEHVKKRLAMPNFSPFYGAPTVIVVTGDKENTYSQYNAGAAIENMLLAAKTEGVGSCWVCLVNGFFETEEGIALLKKIGMPEGYTIMGCVALGYAVKDEIPMPNKHMDEYDKLINFVE